MADRIKPAKSPWFKYFTLSKEPERDDLELAKMQTRLQLKELQRKGRGTKGVTLK